jgi:hypothetical protein
MKAIRTVEWKTKDGRKIKAVIEVTREMNDNVAYADGWNINLGKKPYEAMTINITLDGKYKETAIPQEAIEAYNRYRGDEDAAWEDANELAWSLIRQWTPYIEAQHGMHRGKLQRMINDAAREANYGINEG